MFGHSIKNTGWVRSNHRVHIDKYDDELFVTLECPPCCPSVANEHLLMLEPKGSFWRGSPLGDPQYAEMPVGQRISDDFRCPTWECIGKYEQDSIGLLEGHGDKPYHEYGGYSLDEDSKKVLAALSDGSYDVEIEFCAIYGWSAAGPWGDSEYEWEFGWRFVGEPVELR